VDDIDYYLQWGVDEDIDKEIIGEEIIASL
jgi:hypothetical protein